MVIPVGWVDRPHTPFFSRSLPPVLTFTESPPPSSAFSTLERPLRGPVASWTTRFGPWLFRHSLPVPPPQNHLPQALFRRLCIPPFMPAKLGACLTCLLQLPPRLWASEWHCLSRQPKRPSSSVCSGCTPQLSDTNGFVPDPRWRRSEVGSSLSFVMALLLRPQHVGPPLQKLRRIPI